MNKKILWYILFASLILTGCAEKSGVYDSGSGTYSITNQAATGLSGLQNIRTNAYKEASDFCRQKGKDFEVVNLEQNEGPYILGKYPRITLQFKCK